MLQALDRLPALLKKHLEARVEIQKFKRRKNYHRRTGHRQRLTRIRVLQILTGGAPSEISTAGTSETPIS